MLLFNKGTHQNRFGLERSFGHRSRNFLACRLSPPLRCYPDIGTERVAVLAFFFHQDEVRSFSSSHEIALRHNFSQRVVDRGNETEMEISPQPTALDIWVHARKWRFQVPLLEPVQVISDLRIPRRRVTDYSPCSA